MYALGKNRSKQYFDPPAQAIAHPENRQLLRQELRKAEVLGRSRDDKSIHLFRFGGDSVVMREIGRLRELAFRAVGEGSGERRDMDRYDPHYEHIVLWDDAELEIVGAYRMAHAGEMLARGGRRGLDYLWYGIGARVRARPDVRYLFGSVTIPNYYPPFAKDLLVCFYQHYFRPPCALAAARKPYHGLLASLDECGLAFAGDDYEVDLARLRYSCRQRYLSADTAS